MDAEDLWETTMNPATRRLVQVNTNNINETIAIFEMLMGKSSAARKQFIMSNQIEEDFEDFFGEEIE